ncbi:MAG: hypothetical protein JRJ45_00115 [Deltaproteobacteria bacterium]|nr:hypothetical protein [Deltaproteobacteria bacterium]
MKKSAPKKEVKNAVQYCIDGIHVEDVLPQLKKVDIIGCRIRFGMPIRRQRVVVPVRMRKCGVQTLSEIKSGLEAEIVLDATSPSLIRKAVKQVAKFIDTDPAKASFRYLTIGNGCGSAKFGATTKEMKPQKDNDALDLRKKAKVLGLMEGQGKVNTLCSRIGAEKFRCDIQTITERKIVLCRKV